MNDISTTTPQQQNSPTPNPVTPITTPETPSNTQTDITQNKLTYENDYYNPPLQKPSFLKSTLSSIGSDIWSIIKTGFNLGVIGSGAIAGIKYLLSNTDKQTIVDAINNFALENPMYSEAVQKALLNGSKAMIFGSLLAYGGKTLINALWHYFIDKYNYANKNIEYKELAKKNENTFRSYYNIPDEKERLIQ